MPVPVDENADIAVKGQSATGCGTHTRFFDDAEEAKQALSDITNKEKEREAALAAKPVEEAAEEEAQEETTEENPAGEVDRVTKHGLMPN